MLEKKKRNNNKKEITWHNTKFQGLLYIRRFDPSSEQTPLVCKKEVQWEVC